LKEVDSLLLARILVLRAAIRTHLDQLDGFAPKSLKLAKAKKKLRDALEETQ
jgi:hypothetical protein